MEKFIVLKKEGFETFISEKFQHLENLIIANAKANERDYKTNSECFVDTGEQNYRYEALSNKKNIKTFLYLNDELIKLKNFIFEYLDTKSSNPPNSDVEMQLKEIFKLRAMSYGDKNWVCQQGSYNDYLNGASEVLEYIFKNYKVN